jgi:hypothetical protein
VLEALDTSVVEAEPESVEVGAEDEVEEAAFKESSRRFRSPGEFWRVHSLGIGYAGSTRSVPGRARSSTVDPDGSDPSAWVSIISSSIR